MKNLVIELIAAALGVPVGGLLTIALVTINQPKPRSWGWNDTLMFALGGIAVGFLFGLLAKKLTNRWMADQQPATTTEKTALATLILLSIAWAYLIGSIVENRYYRLPLLLIGISTMGGLASTMVARSKKCNRT